MKDWEKAIGNLVEESVKIMKEEYHKERMETAMELHNKVVDAISELNADPQTVLFVLELLRTETIAQSMARIFSANEGDSSP